MVKLGPGAVHKCGPFSICGRLSKPVLAAHASYRYSILHSAGPTICKRRRSILFWPQASSGGSSGVYGRHCINGSCKGIIRVEQANAPEAQPIETDQGLNHESTKVSAKSIDAQSCPKRRSPVLAYVSNDVV